MSWIAAPLQLLRPLLAAGLAVLFSLQLALSFQPGTGRPQLSENEIWLQICDGAGIRTVIYDLGSGETRELPVDEGGDAPKCPFCVVGMVQLVDAAVVVPVAARFHRAQYLAGGSFARAGSARDFSRVIRAPPVSV
ncbi:hypothetical protein [Pseudodonghicola flavimaris]|uniref:DUF2946 domain-containing protein n=1 Tax=Pseudodonghicola flavimaris TaxID=3050036 RepID=A0ABT7EVC8_9RHOB|nr:hypothetical protein [Pseudodonghicola flavimaris]MDK3016250.1 hypothetical protein [Pseudodonghicola flavimaris]